MECQVLASCGFFSSWLIACKKSWLCLCQPVADSGCLRGRDGKNLKKKSTTCRKLRGHFDTFCLAEGQFIMLNLLSGCQRGHLFWRPDVLQLTVQQLQSHTQHVAQVNQIMLLVYKSLSLFNWRNHMEQYRSQMLKSKMEFSIQRHVLLPSIRGIHLSSL